MYTFLGDKIVGTKAELSLPLNNSKVIKLLAELWNTIYYGENYIIYKTAEQKHALDGWKQKAGTEDDWQRYWPPVLQKYGRKEESSISREKLFYFIHWVKYG